jgi:hypothetical protein
MTRPAPGPAYGTGPAGGPVAWGAAESLRPGAPGVSPSHIPAAEVKPAFYTARPLRPGRRPQRMLKPGPSASRKAASAFASTRGTSTPHPLTQEDLACLLLPTKHTCEVLGFVAGANIDPISSAMPYYAGPAARAATRSPPPHRESSSRRRSSRIWRRSPLTEAGKLRVGLRRDSRPAGGPDVDHVAAVVALTAGVHADPVVAPPVRAASSRRSAAASADSPGASAPPSPLPRPGLLPSCQPLPQPRDRPQSHPQTKIAVSRVSLEAQTTRAEHQPVGGGTMTSTARCGRSAAAEH